MAKKIKEKVELNKILPCDTCLHNKVCPLRKHFEETEVYTTHPYIRVNLECTEWLSDKILKAR